MAPNNTHLANSDSISVSINMATAGVSPVSSPLTPNNGHANHHNHRRLPRSSSGTTPQTSRHHNHTIPTPKDLLVNKNDNPQTPRAQFGRQTSDINSTTPSAHMNLYSAGGQYPPIHVEPVGASPNYFNLTFNPVDPNSKSISNGLSNASSGAGGSGAMHQVHARSNWSPPSSRVRSTAALSPRVLPVDQNPEFEAFRRQSELRGQQALQGGFGFLGMPSPQASASKFRNSQFVEDPSSITLPESRTTTPAKSHTPAAPAMVPPTIGQYLVQEKPRSPKRTLSSPYTNITDRPRRLSPANFTERELDAAPAVLQHVPTEVQYSLPPLSTTITNSDSLARAETLPGNVPIDLDTDRLFTTSSHIVTLLDAFEEEILILDLRVNVQYSRSRIRGALNLCIPPLLLKRATYNTQKLAESFRDPDQREKFEQWRSCKYIIVYDANSSKVKDATPCLNMLKKFEGEGWKGGPSSLLMIRGGFFDFQKQFPSYITINSPGQSSIGSSRSENSPTLPTLPVNIESTVPAIIGGCPMPATATRDAANPFFGNIRQNMDLIGGVGQMEIKIPRAMMKNPSLLNSVPSWLQEAVSVEDAGKHVAAKFLAIEKQEQKRMQEALSTTVRYGSTPDLTQDMNEDSSFKLAGIEKGTKNRYNNIWPYEHSRVKLEDVCDGECDYVNANFVKTPWSNKKYIATQGPIPATFNDFWNVVWQQDVRVIVMLTAETESGQIKAHNYWSQKHYGPLTLTFLSEHRASLEPARIYKRHHHHHSRKNHRASSQSPRSPTVNGPRVKTPSSSHGQLGYESEEPKSSSSDQPYVTVRRFALSNTEEPFVRMREVTHLQYSHWPDFGAPAHPAHLLGLVEQCDAVVRSHSSQTPTEKSPGNTVELPVEGIPRPILVHCSAGCGRTGTFCTVDSVLDMLRRQRMRQREKSTKNDGSPMEVDQGDVAMLDASPLHEDDWVAKEDLDLIEKTVRDFRLQRLSMVQSLRQYVLCYETVLEWMAEQAGEISPSFSSFGV